MTRLSLEVSADEFKKYMTFTDADKEADGTISSDKLMTAADTDGDGAVGLDEFKNTSNEINLVSSYEQCGRVRGAGHRDARPRNAGGQHFHAYSHDGSGGRQRGRPGARRPNVR